MKKVFIHIIVVILLCNWNVSEGQYFEHIDINEGLNSASINAIEKDSLGFMWFASANGVDRYSGSDFKHYDLSLLTSIPYDKNVLSIKNIDGDIWVTLRSGHLLKYNYSIDRFILLANKQDLQFRDALKISEQRLIITGSGILSYDIVSKEIKEVIIEEDNYFRTPKIINNILYVATNKGVYSFTLDGRNIIFNQRFLENEYIQTLDVFNGQLLAGTSEKGLYYLKSDGEIIKHLSFGYGENIQSIKCTDSLIYIGVNRVGLIVLDSNLNHLATYSHNSDDYNSLSINSIHDIFADDEKRVWISTYRKGVDVLDPNNKPFSTLQHEKNNKNSLHNNVVRSICKVSPTEIWFGTERGISVYRHSTKQWNFIKPLQNEAVLQIVKWGDYLALSTFGAGLFIFNPTTLQVVKIYNSQSGTNDFIYKSFVDDKQNLWFAGLEDLYCLDRNQDLKSFPIKNIKSIIQDKDGMITVGTFQGLYTITRKDEVLPVYSALQNDLIWKLYQSDSILLIGTEGSGLIAVNTNTSEVKKISAVTSQVIFDIYQDSNQNIWLLTSKGIGKYNPVKNKYTLYTMHDNLPTNDFRLGDIVEIEERILFICSSFGVVEFYPDEIKDYTVPTNVFITKMDISGNPFTEESPLLLNHLDLSYDQNSLSFTFESTGFTNSKRSLYRWQLAGFDDDWTSSEDRTVSYSNLPAGKYQLVYLASNRDGVWMQNPKILDITIKPPVWASLWAKIFYVIMFGAILGLIFYLYKVKLNRKYSDDKIRSFINIVHDISNMVSVIKLSAERITNGMPENHSTKLLIQNSNRLSNWTNQLISFQKAEHGKLKLRAEEHALSPYIKSIATGFSPLLEQKKIRLDIEINKSLRLWFDRNLMERVINNLLSNAIKYSNEFGSIAVTAESVNECIVISIKDEGIGIPKQDQKEIFKRFYQSENTNDVKQNVGSGIGLMLSKHIVTLHHGKIEFESEKGQGSTFKVYLKKGNSHFENEQIIHQKSELTKELKEVNLAGYSSKHILLIDDNDEFRQSLKEELKRIFKITEARNGEEGIMKATETLPDLIISDIMMPKISGSELCFRLKNDQATSHIPIIILTSLATTQDKVENLEYGADAYIEKPLNLRLLRFTLRNIFQAQEQLKKYYNLGESVNKHPSPRTENAFMGKVAEFVKLQLKNKKTADIDTIASDLGISRSVFYRKMKSITDLTPAAFIQKVKLLYAADLLVNSEHLSIQEIAFTCGFVNSKHFSVAFRKEYATTPSSYRKQQIEKKVRPK